MPHSDPPPLPATNKVSLATAKCIPVFIAAVVAYVSFAITGPLGITYLIKERDEVVIGIAVVAAWYVLLIPVAVTWVRLLGIVFGSSGFVPRGEEVSGDNLEEWWGRDAFVCNAEGLPIWCQYCETYKPDRAHHNQDTGRCTLKMDHFCPWVGGVVGERSMKFFLQFLTYSFVLSTYGMILLAFYVHKRRGQVHWIVALGLTGFFVFFTLGIVFNTLNMLLKNVTSIEAINAESKTLLLAVVLPPEFSTEKLMDGVTVPGEALHGSSGESERPLTSDLDDPAHSNYFSRSNKIPPLRRLARSRYWKGTITYPLAGMLPTDRPPLPTPASRTFAILETPPGLNPWDLGTPWRNLATVLGYKWYDWLLPFKHSPCCDHESLVSFYALGPEFVELLEEVGLVQAPVDAYAEGERRTAGHGEQEKSRSERSKKKRKRRLERGWQHGERPDGWISENEARRARKEGRVAVG